MSKHKIINLSLIKCLLRLPAWQREQAISGVTNTIQKNLQRQLLKAKVKNKKLMRVADQYRPAIVVNAGSTPVLKTTTHRSPRKDVAIIMRKHPATCM